MNKQFIYLFIAALAMPQLLKAQNVGIGTTTPTTTLEVSSQKKVGLKASTDSAMAGATVNTDFINLPAGIRGEYKATGSNDGSGILGVATAPAQYYGTGVTGVGNWIGVLGIGKPGGEAAIVAESNGAALALKVKGNTQISGTIAIAGGNPDAGKVLTSTGTSGEATWQAPARIGAMTQMVNDVVVPYGFTNISLGNTVYNPAGATSFTHFTAPTNGFYHFDVMLWFEGYTGNATNTIGEITIAIVDAVSNFDVLQSYIFKPVPNEKGTKAFSTTIPLDANQQVGLLIVNGNPGTTITLKGSTTRRSTFSGYRVH